MKLLLTLGLGLLWQLHAQAAPLGQPEHSKVESSIVAESDKKLKIGFKVITEKGIKANQEGPWELTLTETDGLKLDGDNGKGSFKNVDFSLPGFQITATPTSEKKSGKLKFKLRSFICTDDKTRCFMEVHNGEMPWDFVAKK